MNKYRTHTCGELNISNKGQKIVLSGWINKKRDHGNLLFIYLRDNYGLTQCVVDNENKVFKEIENLPLETVFTLIGSAFLIFAHYKNYQTCRDSDCDCHE